MNYLKIVDVAFNISFALTVINIVWLIILYVLKKEIPKFVLANIFVFGILYHLLAFLYIYLEIPSL